MVAAASLGCIAALGCQPEPDETDLEDTETEEVAASEICAAPALHRVALSTGVELEYLEQGSPNGDAVIFIHGYTDSHHSFDLNLRNFPRRYHVYALDLRGHGDSDKPACCYAQSDFEADIVAFMDAMGIESASLVGHSMGSFVAHRVATFHPDRVDKLVLVGSAPTSAYNEGVLFFDTVVDTLVDPIDPAFVTDFQASTFYRPIPASFLDTSVSESLKVPAAIWQQALDGLIADDHSSQLSSITAPTLILWGDQDGFFSLADQQGLDSLIPDSTLVVYEGTGHGLHVEQPHRFVHDVATFLD
ncbi:MAG: alpha/beta hydrolase [Polyangiaceae bacterium]|nr:alpha/beta hydrolase [Polyangiaceae bacterium]